MKRKAKWIVSVLALLLVGGGFLLVNQSDGNRIRQGITVVDAERILQEDWNWSVGKLEDNGGATCANGSGTISIWYENGIVTYVRYSPNQKTFIEIVRSWFGG